MKSSDLPIYNMKRSGGFILSKSLRPIFIPSSYHFYNFMILKLLAHCKSFSSYLIVLVLSCTTKLYIRWTLIHLIYVSSWFCKPRFFCFHPVFVNHPSTLPIHSIFAILVCHKTMQTHSIRLIWNNTGVIAICIHNLPSLNI